MTQSQLPGIDRPKRKPPRVIAHLFDMGWGGFGDGSIAKFERKVCGWDSGWVNDDRPDSQIRRGVPCEVCNK